MWRRRQQKNNVAMKKKNYMSPSTEVFTVELQLMKEYSAESNVDIKSSPDDDDSDADNRSRRRSNPWDDEEEF